MRILSSSQQTSDESPSPGLKKSKRPSSRFAKATSKTNKIINSGSKLNLTKVDNHETATRDADTSHKSPSNVSISSQTR